MERYTFFIFGFAKNERENIADDELRALRIVAKGVLALEKEEIQEALDLGALTEVFCDEEEI